MPLNRDKLNQTKSGTGKGFAPKASAQNPFPEPAVESESTQQKPLSATGAEAGASGEKPETPFSGEVKFVGTNDEQMAQMQQALAVQGQNKLSALKFQGMAQRLQELAAIGDGKQRIDLLLTGLVEPESPAEVAFLAMAQQALGQQEVLLPNFMQVDDQGNLLVHCDQMLQHADLETGLNLLPALNASGGKLLMALPPSQEETPTPTPEQAPAQTPESLEEPQEPSQTQA